MQQPSCKILYDYWQSLRAGQIVPRRMDLDPTRISAILPNTLLLERTDHDRLTIRLAGTRLCELFGRELRGHDFRRLWTASDQRLLQHHIALGAASGEGIEISVQTQTSAAASFMTELVLLPLTDNQNVITRWVGAWDMDVAHHWSPGDHLTGFKICSCKAINDAFAAVPRTVDQRHAEAAPMFVLPAADRFVRQRHRYFRVYDGGLSTPDPAPDRH
ncbi:MAG: PAS domain-containing protein [Hyphomicrobiaceae bacterium]